MTFSSTVFTATGVDYGLSISNNYSGVNEVSCIVDTGNDEIAIVVIQEVNTSDIDIDVTIAGYVDVYMTCFAPAEFHEASESDIYVGNTISGVTVNRYNYTAGLTIPFIYPLVDAIITLMVCVENGTNIDIILKLLHNSELYQITNVSNGEHFFNISATNFPESGLYGLELNIANPFVISGIMKYSVLAIQEAIEVVTIALAQYPVQEDTNKTYILIDMYFDVVITLAKGSDLTVSITVENGTDNFVGIKGYCCIGFISEYRLQHMVTEAGTRTIRIDIYNYVSHYRKEIVTEAIYAVNSFSVVVSDSPQFATQALEVTVSVNDAATLPMGTVVCEIDFGYSSMQSTFHFDMMPTEFGSLVNTTHYETHTLDANVYPCTVTCTNQLPVLIISTDTAFVHSETLILENSVANLELVHNSPNISYHPWSVSIIFDVKLVDPSGDLPLGNLTCVFDYDNSGTGDIKVVTGNITSYSNITDTKQLRYGEIVVVVNCSNFLSHQILTQQAYVYINCWESKKYFDITNSYKENPLTSLTNAEKIVRTSTLILKMKS